MSNFQGVNPGLFDDYGSGFRRFFDSGSYFITPFSGVAIIVEKKTCNGYETTLNIFTENTIKIVSNQGTYRVTVKEDGQPDVVFTIKSYLEVLESASKTVQDIFCESCNTTCRDIDYSSYSKVFNALHKLITFVEYMDSSIKPYLSEVFKLTECDEINNTLCTIDTESIQGKYTNSLNHIKNLIAKYYIAIHLFYRDNIDNLSVYISMDYIDRIMQFNKVICCIEKQTDYKYNNYQATMATFNIDVSYLNQAPSSVGDYSTLNVDANAVNEIVLSSSFFTTDTSPAYSDPEGDAPYELKILSLPSKGVLKLNGVDVTVNQIISFTDIDSNLLKLDVSNTTTSGSTSFNFAVSDAGSQNFTS